MNEKSELRPASIRPTRREALGAAAAALGGFALAARPLRLAVADEVSKAEEAIHQEVVFKADRKRVYATLTETKLFDKVVSLSAAMKSGRPPGAAPTAISSEAGGTFTLFGGHIVGRQVELVAGERIVQAWRAATWDPGVYSIARFTLVEAGATTKLVFDHTGFPKGEGEHLAEGWRSNYWEPLAKALA